MEALAQQVAELAARVQALAAENATLRAQVSHMSHMKPGKALLSASAVARELGIRKSSVQGLVQAGALKPLPMRGRKHPRFSRVEVERLAERGTGKRKAGRPAKIVYD